MKIAPASAKFNNIQYMILKRNFFDAKSVEKSLFVEIFSSTFTSLANNAEVKFLSGQSN